MILKGEGGGGVSISSLKYTGKPLFATACASQYKNIFLFVVLMRNALINYLLSVHGHRKYTRISQLMELLR